MTCSLILFEKFEQMYKVAVSEPHGSLFIDIVKMYDVLFKYRKNPSVIAVSVCGQFLLISMNWTEKCSMKISVMQQEIENKKQWTRVLILLHACVSLILKVKQTYFYKSTLSITATDRCYSYAVF